MIVIIQVYYTFSLNGLGSNVLQGFVNAASR